jgi:hypothetical protein
MIMHAVLLAVTDDTMREAHGIANLLFLFLPIFLALVAGLCLLVLSMRRDLDAGKAASLSALAAVVCVGLFHLEAMRHGAAMHAGAPAGPPDASSMQIQRSMEQISAENGMLRDRVTMLEMELMNARGGAPATIQLPSRRLPPAGKTAAPPPIAIPPRPGGPPTPPDASVTPEMPKEATPGPEKDAAPKGEAPKPEAPKSSEGAPPAPPAPPVDGGAGEPKAGEKP